MSGAAGTAGGDRFDSAIAAIDAANSEDPERLLYDGASRPKELLHAELATAWVRRLDPGADELQLLAARAHHFRRWTTPRSEYPAGRSGYLRWRAAAAKRHAAEVAALLAAHGYDDAGIDRVTSIIRKQNRTVDPAVQTHEDALCLTFVQTQLAGVAARLGPDAALGVLTQTVAKMSEEAVRLADEIPLERDAAALWRRAKAGASEAAEPPSTPRGES